MNTKIINDYHKLLDKVAEIKDYIVAFDKLRPQGELAKEQAINFMNFINWAFNDYEVIGNIIDNKELLEIGE